jgi:hypothetical protein
MDCCLDAVHLVVDLGRRLLLGLPEPKAQLVHLRVRLPQGRQLQLK